jgi:hypothetical protein
MLKGTIGSKFYMILRGGCESYLSNEKEGEEIMITKLVGLLILTIDQT